MPTNQPARNPDLDLIVHVMNETGLTDPGIENTGGGVMVATAYTGEGIDTIVATIEDPAKPDATYIVGIYPGTTWHEGPGEDAVHRQPVGLTALGEVLASARDLLTRDAGITPVDLLAWQYQIGVEHPGYIDIPVPGGLIRTSMDWPDGLYGGFYYDIPDGGDDQPRPLPDNAPDSAPFTFTNAGIWDITRIVAVLRDPDHPGRRQILADYPR